MDRQYDMSPEMKRLFELKQKQRAEAKQYYQNLLYNPHRTEKGAPFDPSLIRHGALYAYRESLASATPNYFLRALLMISPIALVYYGLMKHHTDKEEKFRSGTIRYEDRERRFFL